MTESDLFQEQLMPDMPCFSTMSLSAKLTCIRSCDVMLSVRDKIEK